MWRHLNALSVVFSRSPFLNLMPSQLPGPVAGCCYRGNICVTASSTLPPPPPPPPPSPLPPPPCVFSFIKIGCKCPNACVCVCVHVRCAAAKRCQPPSQLQHPHRRNERRNSGKNRGEAEWARPSGRDRSSRNLLRRLPQVDYCPSEFTCCTSTQRCRGGGGDKRERKETNYLLLPFY